MDAFRFGDFEGEPHLLPFTKAESTLVIESLQVEVLWSLEGQGRCPCGPNAVKGEGALIVIVSEAAHQVEPRALLGQAKRHDLYLTATSRCILVVEVKP